MADATIQTILTNMQTLVNAERITAGKLSFMKDLTDNRVDITTNISDFDPQFRYYSVVMGPRPDSIVEEIPKIGNRVQRIYELLVICTLKVPKSKKWIFFSEPNDSKVPAGIEEFTNRVKDILRNQTLSGVVNPVSGRQFVNDDLDDTDPYRHRHSFVYRVSTLNTVTTSGVN